MALFPVVQSGTTVSSGVTLERGDRPFVVIVPSMTGTTVQVQFSHVDVTVATSAEYFTLARRDGTGFPYTAYSGSAPAVAGPITAPTPHVRILLGATTGAARSFQVLPTLN